VQLQWKWMNSESDLASVSDRYSFRCVQTYIHIALAQSYFQFDQMHEIWHCYPRSSPFWDPHFESWAIIRRNAALIGRYLTRKCQTNWLIDWLID
jgi:hypothetical protein